MRRACRFPSPNPLPQTGEGARSCSRPARRKTGGERCADGVELGVEDLIGGHALIKPAAGSSNPPTPCARRAIKASLSAQADGIGDQRGDDGGRRHWLPSPQPLSRARETGRRALLIAGPTASGKSAAALALAQTFGATIVNADSMQVYADLRILTARPTIEEERLAPHRLFGAVDGAVNYSVGRWVRAAREALDAIGRGPVIFVGGTGLYLRALTEGLSDVPPVPEAVRARIRTEAEGRAASDLHAELKVRDPESASRLNASDRQRILRALEVLAATDRPLASFLGARAAPALAPHDWSGVYLAPDRGSLISGSRRGSTACWSKARSARSGC